MPRPRISEDTQARVYEAAGTIEGATAGPMSFSEALSVLLEAVEAQEEETAGEESDGVTVTQGMGSVGSQGDGSGGLDVSDLGGDLDTGRRREDSDTLI